MQRQILINIVMFVVPSLSAKFAAKHAKLALSLTACWNMEPDFGLTWHGLVRNRRQAIIWANNGLKLLTHICVIRPQGFNLFWPSDILSVWQQGSRSTLAQIMACCLTAPSHYLHQCWLMISEVLCHSPDRTIWTPMSSVPKKADKLNLSLSLTW